MELIFYNIIMPILAIGMIIFLTWHRVFKAYLKNKKYSFKRILSVFLIPYWIKDKIHFITQIPLLMVFIIIIFDIISKNLYAKIFFVVLCYIVLNIVYKLIAELAIFVSDKVLIYKEQFDICGLMPILIFFTMYYIKDCTIDALKIVGYVCAFIGFIITYMLLQVSLIKQIFFLEKSVDEKFNQSRYAFRTVGIMVILDILILCSGACIICCYETPSKISQNIFNVIIAFFTLSVDNICLHGWMGNIFKLMVAFSSVIMFSGFVGCAIESAKISPQLYFPKEVLVCCFGKVKQSEIAKQLLNIESKLYKLRVIGMSFDDLVCHNCINNIDIVNDVLKKNPELKNQTYDICICLTDLSIEDGKLVKHIQSFDDKTILCSIKESEYILRRINYSWVEFIKGVVLNELTRIQMNKLIKDNSSCKCMDAKCILSKKYSNESLVKGYLKPHICYTCRKEIRRTEEGYEFVRLFDKECRGI